MYCILLYFNYIFVVSKYHTMKNILTLMFIAISIQLFGQSKTSASLLAEFSQENEVFSMSYANPMEDFFDLDIDLDGKEKQLQGDFSSGRIRIIKAKDNVAELIGDFKKNGFKLHQFEDQHQAEEEDQVHLVYSRKNKDINEAHFIIEGEEELIIFSLFGAMKLVDNK